MSFRVFRITEYDGVVVTAPARALFYMPGKMEVKVTDGTILDMYWNCEFSVLITNLGNAPATHTIEVTGSWDQEPAHRQWTEKNALNPGESYVWKASQWIDFRRASFYRFTLAGDWEADNYSEGVARL
jgi:hypothetical protein